MCIHTYDDVCHRGMAKGCLTLFWVSVLYVDMYMCVHVPGVCVAAWGCLHGRHMFIQCTGYTSRKRKRNKPRLAKEEEWLCTGLIDLASQPRQGTGRGRMKKGKPPTAPYYCGHSVRMCTRKQQWVTGITPAQLSPAQLKPSSVSLLSKRQGRQAGGGFGGRASAC